jgi:hypothetical protein
MHRAPLPDSALKRAQHAAVVVARMTALKLLQQRHRVEPGVDLQQRNDLGCPHLGERVVARSPGPRLALRGQRRALLDSSRASLAEACSRGGRHLRHAVAVLLVLVHLMVRDLLAGHPLAFRTVF